MSIFLSALFSVAICCTVYPYCLRVESYSRAPTMVRLLVGTCTGLSQRYGLKLDEDEINDMIG